MVLEDRPLPEKDRRRYESRLGARTRRSGSERSDADRATDGLRLLDEGEIHLEFGQQLKAAEAFQKGWEAVAESWETSAERAARDLRQIRKHFALLGQVVNREPQLAAALLARMSAGQRRCMAAVAATKTAPQLAGPLAELWFHALDQGNVPPEARDEGTWWVLQAPEAAASDRLLPPPLAERYERELADNASGWDTIRRQALESHRRQMQGPPGQPPGGLGPPVAPDGQALDPALRAREAAMQDKRPVMQRFLEMRIHVRYGQYRKAVASGTEAWGELLRSYQETPPTPFDADLYLETLDDSLRSNPLRAAVLMCLLDPPQRKAAGPLPVLVPKLAERWASVSEKVELQGPAVVYAVWWLEEASRRVPEFAAAQAATLESLRSRLPAGASPQPVADRKPSPRTDTKQSRPERSGDR